jgi:hypothetical protein
MSLEMNDNQLQLFGTLVEIKGKGKLDIDKKRFPLRFIGHNPDDSKRWAVLVFAGLEAEFIKLILVQNQWAIDGSWIRKYFHNELETLQEIEDKHAR